jgi:hypothetical protein
MMGEIMLKGTKGAKLKVLFQGLYMTHVIIGLLVENPPFCNYVFNYCSTTNKVENYT